MELTCSQTEMLLSFYFDGELKENLRKKVEAHLKMCPICSAKYETLVSLFTGMREGVSELSKTTSEEISSSEIDSTNYQSNLSAYIDNELDDKNNIKVKKLTINNKNARKYLEDSYALKNIINNSFEKTKNEAKYDFSKKVLRSLDIDEKEYTLNPIIKGIAVTVSVLLFGTIFSAIILNVGW